MKIKNSLQELYDARVVEKFATASVLHDAVLQEMFARLKWIKLEPQTLVEVGCATGDSTKKLKREYPGAHIIAIDTSAEMIEHAKINVPDVRWICAPLDVTGISDHSVDMIVANLVLPYWENLSALLQEWRRILRADGLLILSALGPDTLRELHALPLAFPQMMDMHVVGDLLTQNGFKHPVLDTDYFALNYDDAKKMWHELQVTGMIAGNINSLALEKFHLTFEVVYAHAFSPDVSLNKINDKGEISIPLSQLRRR